MKNKEFKQIKSIKTPESWIENAINIPQKNKKSTPFYFKPQFIASVASFVLCCTLCLTVFFRTNNNVTVPVAPNTTRSTIQTATDVTDNTQQTETTITIPTLIIPIPTDVVQEKTSLAVNATESTTQVKPQAPTVAFVTEPSEKATESVVVTEPTQATKPVEPTKPTETTILTEPTELPTVPPVIEPPTALPSEPMITEPVTVPSFTFPQSTEPGAAQPTTSGVNPNEYFVTISFTPNSEGSFSSDNRTYCHVETMNGNAKTEKYSDGERAHWSNNQGYFYYHTKLIMYTQYNITFYDEYGNTFTACVYFSGGNINI